MKGWIKRIFLALTGTGIALAAPVVPQDMQWYRSYETVAFDTRDRDLGIDQYAIAGEGEWYIRTVPSEEGNFTSTTSAKAVAGKELVQVACEKCVYYSEFIDRTGNVHRLPFQGRYRDLEELTNAPQPKHHEYVSLLATRNAGAAIAFDDDTDRIYSSLSSVSFSHTVTGADAAIVVAIGMEELTDGDRDVSSVTYDGEALAEGRRQNDNTNNVTFEIWYASGANTGANNVVVNTVGNVIDGYINASSYTGVDQADPLDASNGQTAANQAAISYTLTTVANGAWIVDGNEVNDGLSCSPTSGQTEILDNSDASDNTCVGYEGPIASAGGQTVSWTLSGQTSDDDAVAGAISLTPAAEATSSRRIITLGE